MLFGDNCKTFPGFHSPLRKGKFFKKFPNVTVVNFVVMFCGLVYSLIMASYCLKLELVCCINYASQLFAPFLCVIMLIVQASLCELCN